jgi:hypothetical protein
MRLHTAPLRLQPYLPTCSPSETSTSYLLYILSALHKFQENNRIIHNGNIHAASPAYMLSQQALGDTQRASTLRQLNKTHLAAAAAAYKSMLVSTLEVSINSAGDNEAAVVQAQQAIKTASQHQYGKTSYR